jgi:hypothetical protein
VSIDDGTGASIGNGVASAPGAGANAEGCPSTGVRHMRVKRQRTQTGTPEPPIPDRRCSHYGYDERLVAPQWWY